MQNSDPLQLNAPSLPAGGGTINGLKGDMTGAGPDGAVSLSIPLPISAARGYAPALTLNYHSRIWHCIISQQNGRCLLRTGNQP